MIINDYCEKILPEMDDESIDLIITSPPYNIKKEYEGESIPINDYYVFQHKVIKECKRILKETGSICYIVGNMVYPTGIIPIDYLIIGIYNNLDIALRNRIIWKYNHGFHCKKRFSHRYETILWGTKTDKYIFNLDPVRIPQKYPKKKAYKGPNKGKYSCNPLGKNPGDVWEIGNVGHCHPEKTRHPAQFPEELVRRLVLSLTNEGDMVLDPFAGSGTVGRVCKDYNREYILIEKEKDYCDIIRERLDGQQKKIL